jgi:hypothetical protein
MIKNLLALFLFMALFSCSTQEHKFNNAINSGQCEDAIKNIPSSTSSLLLKKTKHISGTIASYLVTGVTYGTEVTVYVTGGIVGGIVVCSPFIMLEGAAKSHGDASVRCIGEVSGNIMSGNKFGKFGEKVYDGTGPWRCPDLTDLSEGLRRVATCYEAKNNKENLLKAKEQLDIIRNHEFESACVNDQERAEIIKQYDRIDKKLLEIK